MAPSDTRLLRSIDSMLAGRATGSVDDAGGRAGGRGSSLRSRLLLLLRQGSERVGRHPAAVHFLFYHGAHNDCQITRCRCCCHFTRMSLHRRSAAAQVVGRRARDADCSLGNRVFFSDVAEPSINQTTISYSNTHTDPSASTLAKFRDGNPPVPVEWRNNYEGSCLNAPGQGPP